MKKTPFDNYRYRSVVCGAVDWKAYWLTTEHFRWLDYRPAHGYNRHPKYSTETQNVHTLFRKNFRLKSEKSISKALLYITGDDIYKLYLNSVFVGEGPSQSYPFAYNYNCFDVTDLLKSGEENAIGVHVYYQGLYNISLLSADNLHGMIAQLEVTYDDGSKEFVISDRSWKCRNSEARSFRYIFGYQTQFSEDIDMNKWEEGWYDLSHDISDWEKVWAPSTPYPEHYTLIPQMTPAVKHEKVYPKKFEKIENGYFIDFGKELTGTIGISVKQNKGDIIEVRCGEELDENGRVRFTLRANCRYQEFVTLTGKEDLVEFYEYKGYRYAEILNVTNELTDKDVWTLHRNYPFPEESAESAELAGPAKFSSSEKLLEDIWEICVHGVKVGTQDTYLDCPTREKGGFLGDALITGITHLILTGDMRIYKKFIIDCANSARCFSGIVCHVPTNVISTLIDYSMLFPLFLEDYYNYTGDLDFMKEMLPVLDGIIDYYFAAFENSDGLLEKVVQPIKGETKNPAILVDWPPELRDGYDFEKADDGVCTPANMFTCGCIKTAAKLYNIAGDSEKASYYTEKYLSMENAMIRLLYDEERGLFKDCPDSDHCGLHGNALALFYGITAPKGYAPIIDVIKDRRLHCGVYFAYFIIKGLYSVGEYELAYDLISSNDEHSWSNMIRSGATTCMEVWDPSHKWNTSWCHPWSSSPIYFYSFEIMGIKPSGDGWKTVKCAPAIPEALNDMAIDMPVPGGRIKASFVRTDKGIDYKIGVPENVKIIFENRGKDNVNFIAE